MAQLVPPHHSQQLKPLLLPQAQRAEECKRAEMLKKIPLDSRTVSDLLMLAMGAYTPLDGFMDRDDWRGACLDMKRANGVFWPIPITLSVANDVASGIGAEQEVALIDGESGQTLAVMQVREKYAIDKTVEAEHVYRTTDPKHPGVAKLLQQGDVNLAGPVSVLSEGEYPVRYPKLYIRPAEARAMFLQRGWSVVAAFQTRNPMHRSHEYLVKIAVEVSDGVFIHQVLGKLKAGDIPAEILSARERTFRPDIRSRCAMPDRARRSFMRSFARISAARI
jgi:sulfate adenylyltransferase